ncbi:type IV pili fiber building block protein, partial [Francisella tularensis subsp. holarctica]|nr:type IV pili fiber building block protein [Francisella tularensis subsp. holarctica]
MAGIAIIASLAAVAIPMDSHYTPRAQLGSDLSALCGAKATVAEKIANNNCDASQVTILQANAAANGLTSCASVAAGT